MAQLAEAIVIPGVADLGTAGPVEPAGTKYLRILRSRSLDEPTPCRCSENHIQQLDKIKQPAPQMFCKNCLLACCMHRIHLSLFAHEFESKLAQLIEDTPGPALHLCTVCKAFKNQKALLHHILNICITDEASLELTIWATAAW